jgi:hypothetical protein
MAGGCGHASPPSPPSSGLTRESTPCLATSTADRVGTSRPGSPIKSGMTAEGVARTCLLRRPGLRAGTKGKAPLDRVADKLPRSETNASETGSRIKSGTARGAPPATRKTYPRLLPLPVYFLRAGSRGLSGGPSRRREQAGLVWAGGVDQRALNRDRLNTQS